MLLNRAAYWPAIGDTHTKQVVGHNTFLYILDSIITLIVISTPKTPSASNENKSQSNPGNSPGQRPERNNDRNILQVPFAQKESHTSCSSSLERNTPPTITQQKISLVSHPKTVNSARFRSHVLRISRNNMFHFFFPLYRNFFLPYARLSSLSVCRRTTN